MATQFRGASYGNLNCFRQPIEIVRLEDDEYWIEQRCAIQPDGTNCCEINEGRKVKVCATLGCNSRALADEPYCLECKRNEDYPFH